MARRKGKRAAKCGAPPATKRTKSKGFNDETKIADALFDLAGTTPLYINYSETGKAIDQETLKKGKLVLQKLHKLAPGFNVNKRALEGAHRIIYKRKAATGEWRMNRKEQVDFVKMLGGPCKKPMPRRSLVATPQIAMVGNAFE